jgi:uncharacterized DUF497 family protein
MRFDWDRNNLRKIAAHGLTQEEIEQAMRGKYFAAGPAKTPSGEKRWTAAAHVGDKALLIVYTKRKGHIRVVTAYPSRKVKEALEIE